jgi:4'-phosphopantetheinyl transferase
VVESYFETLSEDEQRRAHRFHFAEDRRRFTVARGVLRALLARYLGNNPATLQFVYNIHGKPRLPENHPLRFNVSHSGGLALYAVAWNREIGVDIERLRPEFAGEAIAERFFSRNEVAILRSLPPPLVVTAFFNCWTRKEAYIKARGKGLAIPLDQFDVSLHPGEPAQVHQDRESPAETGRWAIWDLSPAPGFAGAAAVEGHDAYLWCGRWPEKSHESAASPQYFQATDE